MFHRDSIATPLLHTFLSPAFCSNMRPLRPFFHVLPVSRGMHCIFLALQRWQVILREKVPILTSYNGEKHSPR